VNLRRGDGPPLVIGHRGAAAVAPENTLEALQAAIAVGAQLVEFDIGPDGFLGQKPAGPAPAGSATQDMAVVPSARFAYAVAGGNTIYVMPPYCVTAEDLRGIYAAIGDAADAALSGSRVHS